MSDSGLSDGKVSAAARAAAAVWLARLHGPNRTREVEAGLRRWLADDPEHRLAFEQMTETWDRSGRLRRRPIEQVASWELVGFRLSFSRALLATVATAVLAVIGTIYYLRSDVIATGVGDLRTLTLADGTRVHMNSSTRLRIDYGKALRQVRLESGEAFFQVAKNHDWPFVVTANGHEVTALGTQFDVRAEDRELAVTLVEGKVTVAPTAAIGAGSTPAAPPAPAMQVFTLSPGERLTFASTGIAKIDRPSLQLVTAWERGQVVLDDTSLTEAVAEMNAHSRRKIVIDEPAAGAIRVSGIFEAGDTRSFVAALTEAYHLEATTNSAGDIVLTAENPQGK